MDKRSDAAASTAVEKQIYLVSLANSGRYSLVWARSAEQARQIFLNNMFEVSSREATEEEVQEYQANGGAIWGQEGSSGTAVGTQQKNAQQSQTQEGSIFLG